MRFGNPVGGAARNWLAACLTMLVALLAGCGESTKSAAYQPSFSDRPAAHEARREYLFGVHPLHNPAHLFKLYGPIVDLLNARIPEARFALEASRNYDEYDKKLYGRHFDLALPNSYQTINAEQHGYRVFGKVADDQQFRGIILVRKDGGIREVQDLAGKAVSFPAKTALAATMLPQHYLHMRGLPLSAYEQRYVGSQESSIMNAYLGNTAASATWPPPWQAFVKEHPEYAAQLTVLWQTDNLPNISLMARDDFPAPLLARVAEVFFSLPDSSEGREILGRLELTRFVPASGETYVPVRQFVARFDESVRSLSE